jgi:hypothetical protein
MITTLSITAIIYIIISYLIMWTVSVLLVGPIHNPSKVDKLIGILMVVFAPITLPIFLVIFLLI